MTRYAAVNWSIAQGQRVQMPGRLWFLANISEICECVGAQLNKQEP